MDINALNGPKMTEEQIAAYLRRIGVDGPVPLTVEGLGRLQLAHKLTVPFENLDIVAGRPLLLEEGVVQNDGHCDYRYQWEEFFGWVQCQRRPGHDWERIQAFALEPQVDRDFDPVLFFFEKHPDSNMTQFPRPSIYTQEGMLALRRHVFQVERQGVAVQANPTTPAEELRLIQEVFHLDPAGIYPDL